MPDAMHRLLGGVLAVLVARAGADEPSLASYLPADTPVYLEFRNPTPAEMKQLAMVRVFEDPRMKALLEGTQGEDSSFSTMRVPLGDATLSLRSELLSAEDFLFDVVYADPRGERRFRIRNRIAGAIVDFPAGGFPLDVVAAVETDTDAREAAQVLERIAAAVSLELSGGEGDVEAEQARLIRHAEHRGVTYAWADVGPVRLCLAPVGRLVVVASGEARIRDVIDRHAGAVADCLARDPRHLAMLASVPGDGTPTTQIAIHVDRGLARFQASHPQMGMFVQQALVSVGLRDLESITTVARVSGEGVRANTSVLLAPAERRGGLGRLFEKGGPPPSFGGLAFAPEDSFYVNCGSFDAPGLVRTVMELGGFQVAMALAVPLERDFGLKLKEDLAELIGPEVTLIVSPNRGLVPDVALVLESRDAARLEANLLKLLSGVQWPDGHGVSHFKLRDVTVHSVPLGHPRLGDVPLAPTFGVVDGRVLLTAYPLAFQRYLAVKRGDRPSIEKNREFARLRQVVPPGAQGVSYLDLVRLFELFYDTFIPFAQAMSSGAGPSQLYEFPDVETLSQHLFGRVAWRISDERGLQWHSYASMDTSSFTLFLVAGASAGVYYLRSATGDPSLAEPAPKAAREEAVDRVGRLCRHRAMMLRAHLELYRKERGRLPDTLEEIEGRIKAPDCCLVPGTERKRYVYLGPKGRGTVLLHGFPNGREGLVTVIGTDLKVSRVTARELEERLQGGSAGR
jgi:hypothetical protein